MAGVFSANRVDVSSWVNLSPVSVCMWFNITTMKDPERLFGSDDVWEVRISQAFSPGSNRFVNELFGGTGGTASISTTVIATNTWYHAVATAIMGSTSQVYINGLLEASGVCTDTPTNLTLSIGGRNGATLAEGVTGQLDDVRVYNRILTADEIATIYASKGTDFIYSGLQNRWMMNEGAEGVLMSGASSVKDMVGDKHGTPNTSPSYTGSFLKTRKMITWQ